MGVPTFFRWIAKKYPKITSQVAEQVATLMDSGEEIPVDITQPNPNGVEFDNLYLDMNGIIHPCAHPEDKPAPETEEEMYIEIFKYIDRIVNMIRPRKVLYMAIDGVAPRAKMNQQRSRRFRAAQEERIKRDADDKVRQELLKAGTPVPPKSDKKPFDSNCITPGTPFMAELAVCLRYYIADRLTNHPGWKGLKIILSDASVPGEGEHKIMDYIRAQRIQQGYDPNTSHVLYGLDADLIMLALATHEPHFKILREDVFFNEGKQRKCFICNQAGHTANECTGAPPPEKDPDNPEEKKDMPVKPFVFLHISILREYLDVELRMMDIPFAWDLERAIDDWVFMCFFVGNDFLPHLPSLEIREGAIDTLVSIWKNNLPKWGGYLTDSGDIAMDRVQEMLVELGQVEDNVFRKRREDEERKRENRRAKKEEMKRKLEARLNPGKTYPPVSAPKAPFNGYGKAGKSEVPYVVQEASDFDLLPVKGVSAERRAEGNRLALDQLKRTGGSKDQNKNAAELLKARLAGAKKNASGDKNPAASEDAKSSPIVPQKRQIDQEDSLPVEEETEEVVEESGTTIIPGSQSVVVTPSNVVMELSVVDIAQNSRVDKMDVPSDGSISANAVNQKATPALDESLNANKENTGEEELLGEGSNNDDIQVEEVVTAESSDVVDDEPVVDDDDEEEEEDADAMTVVPPPKVVQKVVDSDDEQDANDEVKLWQSGWKERFYRSKFHVDLADLEFRKKVVTSYMEGLAWVLKYYYQGCQSWTWFYPYHYAPFASDCDFVGSLKIRFDRGTPFLPFAQLMGVLPAASGDHIPVPLRKLMSDEESPILDFYPEEFPIDLNGKKYLWQGVALLPFIEEKRLLDAIEPLYVKLSPEERVRNSHGLPSLWVGGSHSLFDVFCVLYGRKINDSPIPLDPKDSEGLFGSALSDPHACMPGCSFDSPLSDFGLPDIPDVNSLSVMYNLPEVPKNFRYPAKTLKGVKHPVFVLTPDDHYAVRNGLNNPYGRGRRGGYQGQRGGFQGGPGHIHPYNPRGGRNTNGNHSYSSYNQGNNGYPKRPRYTAPQLQRNRFDEPYMGGGGYSNNRSAGYTPSPSQGYGYNYPAASQSYPGQPSYQQNGGQSYGRSYPTASYGSYPHQSYGQMGYTGQPAAPSVPQVSGSQMVASLLNQLSATQQVTQVQQTAYGASQQQYAQYTASSGYSYPTQTQQSSYGEAPQSAGYQYNASVSYGANAYQQSYNGQPQGPTGPKPSAGGNIGWARNVSRGRGRGK